jgi:hypothetical protein
VAITCEMFRTSRSNWGYEKRSASRHSPDGGDAEGWPYDDADDRRTMSKFIVVRIILGEGLTTNHGGRMSQTQNAEQREGMGMGKGWAGCCLEERTHANEQPPRQGQPGLRGGRQNFRAHSHLRGARCQDGQVDGSSEEFQVGSVALCICLGL